MKPDDPVTRTVPLIRPASRRAGRSPAGPDLRHLPGTGAEGVPVPMQVPGDPGGQVEVRSALGAVPPDRGDLGDPAAHAPGLADELDADLEAGVGLDARLVDEVAGVRLE